MDWEIVGSVLVALALFVVAMITCCALMSTLMARGMRRKIKAGGTPKCPIPGCPMSSAMEDALRAAEHGEQVV